MTDEQLKTRFIPYTLSYKDDFAAKQCVEIAKQYSDSVNSELKKEIERLKGTIEEYQMK